VSNNPAPFSPLGASVALVYPLGSGLGSTALPGAGGDSCRLVNTAAFPVSVTFAQVAGGAVGSATGMILNASEDKVVSIPIGTTDINVWGIGGTGTVYAQRGGGGN
jgi:hypothetical protein